MKPTIGITTATGWENHREFSKVSHCYADAVAAAGGIPVYIPIILDTTMAEDYLRTLDGLLLSGGDEDVQPHHYGEGPLHGLNNVSPDRDLWEFALIKAAMEQNKPIFGICRGCQILNVAMGGNLYQNIFQQCPGAGEHYPQKTEMHHLYHSVNIEPESLIHTLFVTARSNEGVVEAIESINHPFVVAVQWHPEALISHHPHFIELFKAHIEACRSDPNIN